jgi:hypothetical protein
MQITGHAAKSRSCNRLDVETGQKVTGLAGALGAETHFLAGIAKSSPAMLNRAGGFLPPRHWFDWKQRL